MSKNKNIILIENKMIALLNKISNEIKKNEKNIHDLQMLLFMSEEHINEIEAMKYSIDNSNDILDERVFKNFIIHIDNFINGANELLNK